MHGLAPQQGDVDRRPTYNELKNIFVWAKNNGGMGSLYRSQHELVFVFESGTSQHITNVELGKHGRNRKNVWNYPGVNSFGADRDDLNLHPTVKPVAMVADAMRDCSHRKGIVLDPFAGSGTTLIAAEQTGRRGYGVEIDLYYCDVIVRRLAAVCGLTAILKKDRGDDFETTAIDRRQTDAPLEVLSAKLNYSVSRYFEGVAIVTNEIALTTDIIELACQYAATDIARLRRCFAERAGR